MSVEIKELIITTQLITSSDESKMDLIDLEKRIFRKVLAECNMIIKKKDEQILER